MSTKTNEPILLDATGQLLLTRMQEENTLLSLMAEQHRDTVYSDISQIANIVRTGHGKKAFPVGDQIIYPWTDPDTNTIYPVTRNILGHRDVTLRSGEVVPGMFLGWNLCSPFGVQFSNCQAFYRVGTEGLAAGTYHIIFGATWGNAILNAAWTFTLTQPVPANGLLSGFEYMDSEPTTNWRVKSWTNGADVSPIETVTPVSGATGILIGTLQLTTSTATLNCIHKVARGDNRWARAGLKQYLNKSGLNWFTPTPDSFEIRPNEYTKKAFLSGYTEEFLAATKEIKVTTALNTVEGYANATEDTFDRCFLLSLQEMNITPQLATVEGLAFEYWKRRSALSGGIPWYTTYDFLKIGAIDAPTSAQHVRLRSAHRGHASYTWHVYSSGYVNYYLASDAIRFSPVDVIA